MIESIHKEDDELESPDAKGIATYWKRQIQDEKAKRSDFRRDAKAAQDAYDKGCTFNIMWPTVEITQASLYSSTPNPEVRRRQRDGNRPQKEAAQMLERTIDYCVDQNDFDGPVNQSLQDFLVASLGQVKAVYDVEFTERQTLVGVQEVISAQLVGWEHFSWKHFGWQPCKSWAKCEWVYFEHQMARKAIKKKYKVEAAEEAADDDSKDVYVTVTEIWDKASKTIILIAEQFDLPLEVRKDELGLTGFFPCPEPMMTNVATDKLVPAPDFKYYKDQWAELNAISVRIKKLTKSIKASAYYDSHFKELAKLKGSNDGDYIPIDDLMEKLQNTTSMEAVLAEMPIEHKRAVLQVLTEQKEALKAEVYEILGIGDIMRGETNAQEGVETQQLKSEMGAVRIREKQNAVNRFCRGMFRIMGEIIAEHFEPDVLQKITGLEPSEEVLAILRDDMLRNVSVDIETDSTNAGDKLRKKKEANDTLQAVIGGLGEVMTAMANGMPKDIGQELMLMLVQAVDGNTGNLEDVIQRLGDEGSPESMIQQLQQQMGQLQQENQHLQAELQKVDQADTAKNMTAAKLNDARAQEILTGLPGDQAQLVADIEQTRTETQGKKVEQAANLAAGMGREPFIRGVE